MNSQIRIIEINDPSYPRNLRNITNPPKILYARGNFKEDEKCFAIVGTRKPSPYGKQAAIEIAGELADEGFTIVSGLAPGIDTIAHQTTLEKKGITIAVLGTGLDQKSIYPQSNLLLVERILESGGCLISEYPAGTQGAKFTFPQRNRIISGLSIGVLVVEAKRKSGALITADWAKKQNRKIFAVPGPIHSLNSQGPHFLIKNGAKLTESANDILEELNLPLKDNAKEITGDTLEENLILGTLREESLYVDKIIAKTNLPAGVVVGTLANLEIKNKIRSLGGNIYALAR